MHENNSYLADEKYSDVLILNKITFVRTRSLSNAVTFFEKAYLAPKHTKVTINTSLTSSVI